MGQKRLLYFAAIGVLLPVADAAAGFVLNFSDGSGLSAEAEVQLLNPTTVQIRLRNTSTGVPNGFTAADSLLTGISWDAGHPGFNGDPNIAGGTVEIGAASMSLNFDTGAYGPGTSLGGEWGFGNMDGTGMLPNFISANNAQVTAFGGANLDGPVSIDGPQGGIAANPLAMSLGGLGAVQDEIIATLTMTEAITIEDLGTTFRVEFGSDARFIETNIPGPGALVVLGAGMLAMGRRRRRA